MEFCPTSTVRLTREGPLGRYTIFSPPGRLGYWARSVGQIGLDEYQGTQKSFLNFLHWIPDRPYYDREQTSHGEVIVCLLLPCSVCRRQNSEYKGSRSVNYMIARQKARLLHPSCVGLSYSGVQL